MLEKLLPRPTTAEAPCGDSRPVYGVERSRAIEAAAQAALPPHALIERAGLAIARLALALQPRGAVWIACGPGNNGGDGLIAARRLHAAGTRVKVSLVGGTRAAPPDAAHALAAAQAAGVPIAQDLTPPPDTGLAIDALLGLGIARAPQGPIAAAIAELEALAAPKLAIDLPSGLDADAGIAVGAQAVRARYTLALLTLKPGLLTAHGRAHAGELWFDDLGIAAAPAPDAWLLGNALLAAWRTPRNAAAHKGSHGDVLVLGGAPGMRGAAQLAARAALTAGAGRVHVALLDAGAVDVDAGRPELMRMPLERLDAAVAGPAVIVAGCGGGDAIAARLAAVLREAARLVLDADGLNAVAADAGLRKLLSERAVRAQPTIITPHPLEAARLLGHASAGEVQADRLAAARQLAERLGCIAVLKGSGSIVASPGHIAAINGSGGAALATAGTGDVLAGWLGGLWAQRPAADPHTLACTAVHWHGLAGESEPAGPLRAADLIERMHALRRAAPA